MKKIKYTLLISPPGGGKSTWLKNNLYDIFLDDISIMAEPLKMLAHEINMNADKSQINIALADINFCEYESLTKAWTKLTEIAEKSGFQTEFENILFLGDKKDYQNNVKSRNDSRNVEASINIFSPKIKILSDKEFENKTIINIKNYKNALPLSISTSTSLDSQKKHKNFN